MISLGNSRPWLVRSDDFSSTNDVHHKEECVGTIPIQNHNARHETETYIRPADEERTREEFTTAATSVASVYSRHLRRRVQPCASSIRALPPSPLFTSHPFRVVDVYESLHLLLSIITDIHRPFAAAGAGR